MSGYAVPGWKIWVRTNYRSCWRRLETKLFDEYWEAHYYIDKNTDFGKDSEAIALPAEETPWLQRSANEP